MTPAITPDLRSQIAALQMNQAGLNAIPAPSLDAPDLSGGGGTPMFAQPTMPTAIASPTLTDQAELRRLKDTGDGVSQIKNPLVRGIGRAGDVALSVFGGISPVGRALDMALPGTSAHHELLVHRQQGLIADDQAQAKNDQMVADEKAQQAQTQALTSYTQQRPAIEQSKLDQKKLAVQQKVMQQAAAHGQIATFDEDGVPTFADDPSSEIVQRNKVMDDVHRSKQDLQDAQTAFESAKTDPTSPLFKQTAQRLAIAQQNAQAAGTRAQAYLGNYLKGAFNTDLHGDALPGAPQIEDGDGHVTTVGATNAGSAAKAQTNVAQFNDVHGALDNLEQTARALVKKGGSLNSPAIVYALQHPTGTPTQFLQSLDKANLSPEERAYVISVQSAHENVQALRKAAGGTATDSSVAKLDQLIPNATTPDLDYLLNQTGQIRQTAERLGKGVTTAKGGQGVRGGHANQAPSGAEHWVRDSSGNLVPQTGSH